MPSISRRQRAVSESSAESDNEEQGRKNDRLLSRVDQQYLNRPIDQRQGDSKLKQLVGNFSVVSANLKNAAGSLRDVAAEMATSLAETYNGQDLDEHQLIHELVTNPQMKTLDEEFRTVLVSLHEAKVRTETISNIRQKIVQGHQITNVYERYTTNADAELKKYSDKTAREKFQDNKEYVDYIRLVWESFTNGQNFPNIKNFLPREKADAVEESDEELEIGAQSADFRCPLSMTILEDPYTSKLCPHSFSGQNIREYLAQSRGSAVCPVGGCSKRLTLDSIEPDAGLKRRVEAHKQRAEEGRTQQATQSKGRTYIEMDDSDDE
ncbi:hypothetical protein JCM10212_002781 [Sporobolomyces blumeae]